MKCTSEVSIAPRYRTVGDLVGFVTGKKNIIPIVIIIII